MKIKIRFADDLGGVLQTQPPGHRHARGEKPRLGVLEINAVGHVVEQRAQQVALERELFLHPLALRDIPKNALNRSEEHTSELQSH